MNEKINPAGAVTLCQEEKLFAPGDLVQLKSQIGSAFPVYTVGEMEFSPKEKIMIVKVWYYNNVDGDIKVAIGPQSVFRKVVVSNSMTLQIPEKQV